MAYVYQLPKDTAANWTSANPTLPQGVLAYETDTGKMKLGDGTTAWNSLSYHYDPNGGVTLADVITYAIALGG